MQPGNVPSKAAGNYVLILNSSEDELAALAQYANPVYVDQIEALESMVLEPELRDVQLILRVHPNLKGVKSEQTRRTDALAGVPNLHIIGPEEEIDTYSLMDGADLVVSFGSTAGIESVFWGVPSILIGRAPFEELGVNTPDSHDAAVQMILDPPAAAPIEAALPYGYFVVAFGEEFLFYEQTSYFSGAFEGSEVRPSLLPRLVRKTRNALRLLQSNVGAWRGQRRDGTFRVAD